MAGTNFTYDDRGNLTSDGTNTFAYTSENLLKSIGGGGSATLAYDPAMRLFQVAGTSTTRFAYDGLDLIGEYSSTNSLLRRYVHGPGMDEPLVQYEGTGTTDRRFMQADERGSITAISDSSGNLLTANSYDEYGIPGVGNSGRFQYTGQTWLPEVGLYYYKARMYSPTLGRFMQTDPIGTADGINIYAYAGNDPVDWVDPLGLEEEIVVTGHRPHSSLLFGELVSVINWSALMGVIAERETGEGEIVVTGRKPQKEEPKKAHGIWKYGNWCGVGGAGAAIDAVDAACRAHDQCYAANGLSALDNLTVSSGSLQRCNQRLCNSVRQVSPPPPPSSDVLLKIRRSTPEEDRYLAAQQIDLYFSSFLIGDNACH